MDTENKFFLNSVPLFSGNEEGCSVMEYFNKFECVSRHFSWTSDEKVYYAKLRLQGDAKNYVQKINYFSDYDSLKNCLIEQFFKRKEISQNVPSDNLSGLVQPPSMSVKEFISRVETLSHMAASKKGLSSERFVTFRTKVEKEILLTKMRPQLLERVLKRQPQSLKQIKHFAIQEERMVVNSMEIESPTSLKSPPLKEEVGGTVESLNGKLKDLNDQVMILTNKVNYLDRLLNCPPDKLNDLSIISNE